MTHPDLPTPKYKIGDTVWHSGTVQTTHSWPCPDCKGTKLWVCTTPAGVSFDIPCQRCSFNYGSAFDKDIRLTYQKWGPATLHLTIGSIRVNSANDAWEADKVSYMCIETGIGSGSIYYENKLFATQEEAETASRIAAYAQNFDAQSRDPEAYTRWTRSVAGLPNALEAAYHSDAWQAAYAHNTLVSTIEEWAKDDDITTLSEMRETLKYEAEFDKNHRHHHTTTRLLRAAAKYPELQAILDEMPPFLKNG